MLHEARRAGEALIAAKKLVAHGRWADWLKAHVPFSQETAGRYMKMARLAQTKSVKLDDFDGGLAAFLEAHASRRMPTPPEPPKPTYDRDDAEHAKKLQAMAKRGGSENERSVAKRKLEAFARARAESGMARAAKYALPSLRHSRAVIAPHVGIAWHQWRKHLPHY